MTNRTAIGDRRHITREELRNRIDSGKPMVIYDARSHEAWSESESKLPGALRISNTQELADAGAAPDGSLIVVYDSDGQVDIEALLNDLESGTFEALVLAGGFDAWQAADYPLENKTVQEKQMEMETDEQAT